MLSALIYSDFENSKSTIKVWTPKQKREREEKEKKNVLLLILSQPDDWRRLCRMMWTAALVIRFFLPGEETFRTPLLKVHHVRSGRSGRGRLLTLWGQWLMNLQSRSIRHSSQSQKSQIAYFPKYTWMQYTYRVVHKFQLGCCWPKMCTTNKLNAHHDVNG